MQTEETVYTTKMRATNMLYRILDEAKGRSQKLRYNGRRCCANQMLHFSKFVEGEIKRWKE